LNVGLGEVLAVELEDGHLLELEGLALLGLGEGLLGVVDVLEGLLGVGEQDADGLSGTVAGEVVDLEHLWWWELSRR
jgi:hypothetical protein